jgi:hypothetical protein
MDANTGLMVLSGALVVVTAYYAWTVRRMVASMQDMVAATKEMVETASRSQTLSLAPQVQCRTVNYDGAERPAAGAAAGQMVSETIITNVGSNRVRLSRVRLETDTEGEHVRRFVTHWLEPGGRETVQIPFGRAGRTKVLVHLEDLAGQSHTVVSEPAPGQA